MQNTVFRRDLNVPADLAWDLLDDFKRLDWFRLEHQLEVVGDGSPGTVRIIKMEGAEPCWEVLLARDPDEMSVTYAVPVGLQVPVSRYSATMRIELLSEGQTRLHWHSTWIPDSGNDPEAISSEFIRIYNALADGIETVLQEGA